MDLARQVLRDNPWLTGILVPIGVAATFLALGWIGGIACLGLFLLLAIVALYVSLRKARIANSQTADFSAGSVRNSETEAARGDGLAAEEQASTETAAPALPERVEAQGDSQDAVMNALDEAFEAARNRQPYAVLVALRPIIEASDEDTRKQYERVQLSLQSRAGDHSALEQLRRRVQSQSVPDLEDVQWLVYALRAQGQDRQAIQEMERVRHRLKPEVGAFRIAILESESHREVGNPTQALEVIRRVPVDDDFDAGVKAAVLKERGMCLLELNRPNESLPCLERSLELNPQDNNVRFKLAYTYSELGLHEPALSHYRSLTALDAKNRVAMNNLGVELHELGMTIEGTATYKRAADMDLALAYGNLGASFLSAGLVEEAQEMLLKGAALDPKNVRVASVRAQVGADIESESKELDEIEHRAFLVERTIASFGVVDKLTPPLPSGTVCFSSGEQVGVDIDGPVASGTTGAGGDKVSISIERTGGLLKVNFSKGEWFPDKWEGIGALNGDALTGYWVRWPKGKTTREFRATIVPGSARPSDVSEVPL